MATALITGITGQDGSYLAQHLLEQGYDVYGLVRGQANPKRPLVEALMPDVTVIEGDLLDCGPGDDGVGWHGDAASCRLLLRQGQVEADTDDDAHEQQHGGAPRAWGEHERTSSPSSTDGRRFSPLTRPVSTIQQRGTGDEKKGGQSSRPDPPVFRWFGYY